MSHFLSDIIITIERSLWARRKYFLNNPEAAINYWFSRMGYIVPYLSSGQISRFKVVLTSLSLKIRYIEYREIGIAVRLSGILY
ncbi:MAG: hypothetical protein Hyperionvirus6_95 [Hyperionvirus sp.]|uniref:Uncharacterized protein n=1 Tax=Hyperionvirus sp. TaxID=2487770 RepID=A0A3G5AA98_9VIRU|nr:MAG: hypothetical protein Hyperionvirus6_95 [Hyperionvirus sp.]